MFREDLFHLLKVSMELCDKQHWLRTVLCFSLSVTFYICVKIVLRIFLNNIIRIAFFFKFGLKYLTMGIVVLCMSTVMLKMTELAPWDVVH